MCRLVDYMDVSVSQAVEFVDQLVDLFVGGVDLALDCGLLMACLRCGKPFVQFEHCLDQFDHPVVTGFVGGVGEVNRADGESLDELCEVAEEPAPHGRADAFQVEVEK